MKAMVWGEGSYAEGVRQRIVRLLLAALNSRWLNPSPCRYGYIGNVDAFELDHLRSEESQRPGITVATIIREAETFSSCGLKNGLTVIEDGVPRQATVWDLRDLERSLKPPGKV
jgi:hypothetical protein